MVLRTGFNQRLIGNSLRDILTSGNSFIADIVYMCQTWLWIYARPTGAQYKLSGEPSESRATAWGSEQNRINLIKQDRESREGENRDKKKQKKKIKKN